MTEGAASRKNKRKIKNKAVLVRLLISLLFYLIEKVNSIYLPNLAIAAIWRYNKYMTIKKYKYFLKKPKSEITKDILYWLLIAGAISVAATSPYFLTNFLRHHKRFNKYQKKQLSSAFYKLKKNNLLNIEKRGRQIHVSLTKQGKKKANWLQIDDLEIPRPKKWDGKWRLVIFDIAEIKKSFREAFRGKLIDIGFKSLQKSIWLHPFDCEAEIEVLRTFFNLSEKELRLVIAEKIGNDAEWRRVFDLSLF